MRELYELDGITYILTVAEYSSGFYGNWVCDECGVSGTHGVASESHGQAMNAAKENLLGHHQATHGKM